MHAGRVGDPTRAYTIGLGGLSLPVACPAILIIGRIRGSPDGSPLGLMAVPLLLGIIGETLFQISRVLARKRGFEYDFNRDEASRIESGRRVTCKWSPRSDANSQDSRPHGC